jgi:peptidoglycan/LPS O-acetylase OafA/YrhL
MSLPSALGVQPSASSQILSLTGFRAYAALAVLLGHIMHYEVLAGSPVWWLQYGWTGVNCFFALSGFLFTLLYFDVFEQGKESLSQFAVKRFIRIYPMYFLLIMIEVFGRGLLLSPDQYGNIFSHLTMLHGMFREYRFSINPPAWTITVELCFYALFPPLIILLARGTRWLADKPVQRWVVQSIIILVLVQALQNIGRTTLDFKYDILRFTDTDNPGVWTGTIFGRCSDFAWGIIGGLWAVLLPKSVLFRNRRLATLMVVGGCGILYAVSAWTQSYGGVTQAGSQEPFLFTVYGRSYALGATMIILGLYGHSYFNVFFEHRIPVYIGTLSYAIYLTQFVSVGGINQVAMATMAVARTLLGYNEWLSALVTTLAMLALSAVVYHAVEEPLYRILRKRWVRK